ncbi:unnamed protein product [Cunninghamella blakesleeana]
MTNFFNKLGRKNGNTNEPVQISSSKSTPRQTTTKSLNRLKTVKGQTARYKKKQHSSPDNQVTSPTIDVPPSENEIDQLFEQMLERRGIHDKQIIKTLKSWPSNKKWLMVNQDTQAELLTTNQSTHLDNNNNANTNNNNSNKIDPHHQPQQQSSLFINVLSEKADKMKATLDISHYHYRQQQQPQLQYNLSSSSNVTNSTFSLSPSTSTATSESMGSNTLVQESIIDDNHNSPEYFVRRFLDLRTVTLSDVANLEICLRTRSITWLKKFIDLNGLNLLMTGLNQLNHQSDRSDKRLLDLENEFIKCIKAIINTRHGGYETVGHQNYIPIVVFSLISPHWQTRKLVCEILAFFCYLDKGHEKVLLGFDLLKQYKKDMSIFDTWLKDLEITLDGRGRMGSLVGAHDDLKKLGLYNAPDQHLMEYAISNMILINAITKVSNEVSKRIQIRSQLNASGMENRILPKLESLGYPEVNYQIQLYKEAAENDIDEAYGQEILMYKNINDPTKLLDLLLLNIVDEAPKSMNYILGILRNMLLVKGDPETIANYFRMMDILISQVVMNKSFTADDKDFTATYGISVGNLIQQFSDLDKLHQFESEAIRSREIISQLTYTIQKLETDVSKLKANSINNNNQTENHPKRRSLDLKKENESLRFLLQTSKKTMFMLEKRVSELTDMMERNDDNEFINSTDGVDNDDDENSIGFEWKAIRKNGSLIRRKQSTDSNSATSTTNLDHNLKPSNINKMEYHLPGTMVKPSGGMLHIPARKSSYLNRASSDHSVNYQSKDVILEESSPSSSIAGEENVTSRPPPPPPPHLIQDSTSSSLALPPPPPPPPPPSNHIAPNSEISSLSPPPPPPPPPSSSSVTISSTSTSTSSISTLNSSNNNANNSSIPPIPKPAPRKTLQNQPQLKLKNIQWQKLDLRHLEKTVWSLDKMDESNLESKLSQLGIFNEIDSMFAAKTNTLFQGKLKATSEEKKDTITFLSRNKSRNINITVLPKVKQFGDFNVVRKKIMQLDDDICTEIFLTNLISSLPSQEDDLKTMEHYINTKDDEESKKLDIPEQFTVEMMKTYRYKERLNFMLFRVQFWEIYDHLTDSMTTIADVTDSLYDSKNFHELLGIILMMGNYMNGSSFQGGAFGIRISSLTKLVDTKSTEHTHLTFLHVLIGLVRKEFPHILGFLDDLNGVGSAARIMASINDLMQQYTEMRQNLKKLDQELKEYWIDNKELEEDDQFLEIMMEHFKAASNRFEDLETLYLNMDNKWKNTMIFYGENPKVMRPDDFFSIFAQFTHQWKVTAVLEKKLSEQKEREERLEQQQEKLRKKSITKRKKIKHPFIGEVLNGDREENEDEEDDDDDSNGPHTPPEEKDSSNLHEDRRIMDNLLDVLRSGDSLQNTRQKRRAQRQLSTKLIQSKSTPTSHHHTNNIDKHHALSSNSNNNSTSDDHDNNHDGNGDDDDDDHNTILLAAEELLRNLQND